jgi:alcohol dehydrogenase class IV
MGLSRVLIVTDENVAATGIPQRAAESMQGAGLKPTIFSGVHVEPTDESMRAAVEFARETDWDGFVAIGGGSSIDTAKAINLLTTNPGDLMDYINKPVGDGKAPTEPLKPLIAVPTTAGTGRPTTRRPMVPHGESVSLTAPAAFRFTFPASPERHLRAAAMLDPGAADSGDPRERLPRAIVSLMRDVGMPNGIGAVGLIEEDIPDLVEGALKQQRILAMAPRDVMPEDLAAIFRRSIDNW